MTTTNCIPRRIRIDLATPAETAIRAAEAAVEAAGADVRLTKALIKLQEARALVADFVDGVPDGEGYPRVVGDGANPPMFPGGYPKAETVIVGGAGPSESVEQKP